MSRAPEAFFHPATRGGGHRLYLHHTPPQGTPVRSAVLYVHPWAEEMNKSRRMAAMASRALAEAGHAVLQVDLLGCGDSSGDFGDATWEAWVDDLRDAAQWLQARHTQVPLWLWGLRVGALLAAATAAQLTQPVQLLMWQPVLQGRHALQQFLRLKAAAQLAEGSGKGVVEALRAELTAGRAVEVAGYTIGPGLAKGLDAATLTPPTVNSGPSEARPRAVWLEVNAQPEPQPAPAARAALPRWVAAGWALEQQAVAGPAFWQTQEIEDAPALVEATLKALTRAWDSPSTEVEVGDAIKVAA